MVSNLASNPSFTKSEAQSSNGMVATKDRLSTEAGLEMLKMGGNAVDAGVAACLAVGVVEPESSGIGGGGYMTFQVGNKGGVIGFPMKGPLSGRPDLYELTGEASVGSFGWSGVKMTKTFMDINPLLFPDVLPGY